ncbi:putative U2 snRNP component ist3 [[Candida] jaroonii]|uniref:U2 snRNP component ist3 n=1 Tax=[Candida] jaroonii TaxID=467808 RepID=A0ACA9YEA3_9ASCO|nr:putative U2 snRNP component ist3 [[Candida] jaroonii]
MNKINRINQLNKQELGLPIESSWHQDYKDSNYIFISNIHESLKHKDVLIIFSQFGLPTHLKLIHPETQNANKDEAMSGAQNENFKNRKKFAFLKFEKWESCVMTIDNLNGTVLMGSKVLVDHCWFNLKGDEKEEDFLVDYNEYLPKSIESSKHSVKKTTKIKPSEDVPQSNEGNEDNDNELRDPMENITRKRVIGEVQRQSEDEEDDFKDPMSEFLSKKSKHKHRHKHRHKSKDKEEKNH